MVEAILVSNLWITLALWGATYVSDYYLTLYAARLHQAYGRDHISYGGSLELTPQFQSDIDNLRLFSPRFLRRLAFSLVAISVLWLLSILMLHASWLFSLFVGALILREAAVHVRHMRNIALLSYARKPGNLIGRIEYSRQLVLGQSAVDLFSFAALFLFISAISGSWFLLGGALACAITGGQHWSMAKKASRIVKPEGSMRA